MYIADDTFSKEYNRIKNQMREIELKLGNRYTSDSNWLWLDGRKTTFEWIMRLAE